MNNTEKNARSFVLILLILVGLLQTIWLQGLYGDGAFFLLTVIRNQASVDFDFSRSFVIYLTQWPLILSLKAGLEDLRFISSFHTFLLTLFSLGVWWLALFNLRKEKVFWVFLLLFCMTYFHSSFLLAGEYNVAFALISLSLSMLVSKHSTRRSFWIVAISSFVLIRSYPAVVYLSLVLIFFLWRKLNSLSEKFDKLPLYFAIAFNVFAISVGAWSILNPRDVINLINASQLFSGMSTTLFLAFLCSVSFVSQSFISSKKITEIVFILGRLLALLCLVPSFWAYPSSQHEARLLCGLILAIFSFFIFKFKHLEEENNYISYFWVIPLCLCISLSVARVIQSSRHFNFLKEVSKTVNTTSGLVELSTTNIDNDLRNTYNWDWTYPTLSVLLRDDPSKGIILNRAGIRWEPFDPHFQVFELPDGIKRISNL